jgi:hypothetical protein
MAFFFQTFFHHFLLYFADCLSMIEQTIYTCSGYFYNIESLTKALNRLNKNKKKQDLKSFKEKIEYSLLQNF